VAQDLHELPKLRDSLSYLYVEHAIVDRKDSAVELISKNGRVLAPVAAICVLMIGPGVSITHAAVKVLAENGCSILWVGENGMRCYAQGMGETRKAFHILRQAALVSDDEKRTQVVLRMYRMRFQQELEPDLSLAQIRGMEGARMRTAYAQASARTGVPWQGRQYNLNNWGAADPINRALSAANALLNGICHAAIVSGGYSPALGFIHTGRQLSFVYDIADLYKTEITIPIAFETVAESAQQVDSRVRKACRERFYQDKLLERILPDIDTLMDLKPGEAEQGMDFDSDVGIPETLWEVLEEEAG
jgi:CRISPR-associated protein Cas1